MEALAAEPPPTKGMMTRTLAGGIPQRPGNGILDREGVWVAGQIVSRSTSTAVAVWVSMAACAT